MRKNIFGIIIYNGSFRATSHVDKEVLDVMIPYFVDSFGNASIKYSRGQEAIISWESALKE